MCYSFVIGPSAPSPSSSCADVIVFFGTTPASFLLWCFAFFVVSSFRWMHVCLGGPNPGHELLHLLTNRVVMSGLVWGTITHPPASNTSITVQPVQNQTNACLQTVTLPFRLRTSIHVWTRESMPVCNTFMCTIFVCTWVCPSVFLTLLVPGDS